MADVALALALAGVGRGGLAVSPTFAGRCVESFVAQQLLRQIDRVGGVPSDLRTGSGEREVDAVIEIDATSLRST